jgi:hypothetical protein
MEGDDVLICYHSTLGQGNSNTINNCVLNEELDFSMRKEKVYEL